MQISKRLIYAVSALPFCFVIGIGFSYLWPHKTCMPDPKLASRVAHSEHVFHLYQHGDYATAKAALLDLVRIYDEARYEKKSPDDSSEAVDAMLTFVRLAKLEEKNNGSQREEYMREASARCARFRLKWNNCSEEALRREVDRMDALPYH